MTIWQSLWRLRQQDPYADWIGAVGLTGNAIGQRAFWLDGKLVFATAGARDWQNQEEAAMLPGCGAGKRLRLATGDWFVERLAGKKRLIVCGAGHIPLSLVDFAHKLGFAVTVIDDRPQMATQARFPLAERVICAPFDEALRQLPSYYNDSFVLVTNGPDFDLLCLQEIRRRPFAYVGMLGSRRRIASVRQGLAKTTGGEEFFHRIHAPIGLSIGAETPEEISVAILAQIIQNRSRCPDGFGLPDAMLAELASDAPCALATIVAVSGSVPRQVGTKMLIRSDGSCLSTIGGSRMEEVVRQQALLQLRQRQACLLRLDMMGIPVEPSCSSFHEELGILEIFVEPNLYVS